MFTGLIQALGTVESLSVDGPAGRLSLRAGSFEGLSRGESIAVNGVCLTFVEENGALSADLSAETLARTALGVLQPGSRVNLERALLVGDRLGGHIVQGHVDCVGELLSIDRGGSFATCRWSYPPSWSQLVIEKGSIAIDGVSLTVIDPDEGQLSAALIPETLERTNLGRARPGDRVNLEFDLFAKYARNFLGPYLARIPGA